MWSFRSGRRLLRNGFKLWREVHIQHSAARDVLELEAEVSLLLAALLERYNSAPLVCCTVKVILSCIILCSGGPALSGSRIHCCIHITLKLRSVGVAI